MGVIKKNQIHEIGTMVLEKSASHSAPIAGPKLPSFPSGPSNKEQIQKAKNEAQKIIDKAVQESEAIKNQAQAEGTEQGKSEASGKITEALETLNQAVKERKKIISDSEGEILRLAIKVAEQIIRSEVSLHRDVCLNIVAEAIARVSDREQIIVKVNREDAEYLKRYKDRLAGMLDGVKSFSIIEDAQIEPGGCVIETNLGFVDAKMSTKLQSVEDALQQVREQDVTD